MRAATTRKLPPRPRSIIGREAELLRARELLLRADARLVTLIGPPGVGKTRMAVELATLVRDQFEHGVWFVDLSPIGDASLVADAAARALGFHQFGSRQPVAILEEFLADKVSLLVLDNFEQVLDAAELVCHLLANCPGLKIVTTSRAALHVRWEREFAIMPLKLPETAPRSAAEALAASPAVQLFLERAQAVAPGFVLADADARPVVEICVELDGLPLAIELAAARIKLFSPRALLRRLNPGGEARGEQNWRFELLASPGRDVPPRQQTLLGAMTWSYELLNAEERRLFRSLAVFVGGCTLAAAEAVSGFEIAREDLVVSLVDKSLLWSEEAADGEPRLRMLETIREYARTQLEASGETERVRQRHTAYFVDLAEQAQAELSGRNAQTWLARLERERDNLRAVERRAVEGSDGDTVVRLAAALWPFWLARGDATEIRDRLVAGLPLIRGVGQQPRLARAMEGMGLLAEKLGDYARCRSLLEEAVAHARQFDDRRTLAGVLDSLGRQYFIEGRYSESRATLDESLAYFREIDDGPGLARALSHVGFLDYLEGKPEVARGIFQEGLALATELEDQHRIAEFLDNLGTTYEVEQDFESAERMYHKAVAVWREIDQGHWLAMSLNNLGRVQTRRGERAAARASLREALSLARRVGNRRRMTMTLLAVASLAAAEGDEERAERTQRIAATAASAIGARLGRATHANGVSLSARRTRADGIDQAHDQPTTLEAVVDDALAWLAEPDSELKPALARLTTREREVTALIARGLTNREIADALLIAERTVTSHVEHILDKLNFRSRAQVAAWATEQRLGR